MFSLTHNQNMSMKLHNLTYHYQTCEELPPEHLLFKIKAIVINCRDTEVEIGYSSVDKMENVCQRPAVKL